MPLKAQHDLNDSRMSLNCLGQMSSFLLIILTSIWHCHFYKDNTLFCTYI